MSSYFITLFDHQPPLVFAEGYHLWCSPKATTFGVRRRRSGGTKGEFFKGVIFPFTGGSSELSVQVQVAPGNPSPPPDRRRLPPLVFAEGDLVDEFADSASES
jgi:hypothetical protein